MPERELRARLERLHRELEGTGAVDAGSREVLSQLLVDIADLLERSDDSDHTHHSLSERLREATRDFEESHPKLAAAVGRVVDQLSNMGI